MSDPNPLMQRILSRFVPADVVAHLQLVCVDRYVDHIVWSRTHNTEVMRIYGEEWIHMRYLSEHPVIAIGQALRKGVAAYVNETEAPQVPLHLPAPQGPVPGRDLQRRRPGPLILDMDPPEGE